jgi:hypothetical protein
MCPYTTKGTCLATDLAAGLVDGRFRAHFKGCPELLQLTPTLLQYSIIIIIIIIIINCN